MPEKGKGKALGVVPPVWEHKTADLYSEFILHGDRDSNVTW